MKRKKRKQLFQKLQQMHMKIQANLAINWRTRSTIKVYYSADWNVETRGRIRYNDTLLFFIRTHPPPALIILDYTIQIIIMTKMCGDV